MTRGKLVYVEGSDKESSVKAYIKWLQGFGSISEAMSQAFKTGVTNADDFLLTVLREAYQEISKSTDPAVSYFADTLTVLPKQQRDAIPCVEWLGPEQYRSGMVSTPGGDVLGFINRRTDGLWAITPSRNGPVMVSAIAESQTDARCYLADLLSRSTRAIVENEERQLRAVGEEHDLFKKDHDQVMNWWEGAEGAEEPTFQVTFWDDTHGLLVGCAVRLEATSGTNDGIIDILEGTVTEVKGHEVFVQGREFFDVERQASSDSP